jgi:trimeric autotransporter adhesin
VALGHAAKAYAKKGIAIGNNATAGIEAAANPNTAYAAIAIGENTRATGTNAVALGWQAQATAENSVAIGRDSEATHTNSTAIGSQAKTTRENQIVLGTGTTTYTMAGINSAASRAAQQGATNIVTSDAFGNLATSSLSLSSLAGDVDMMKTDVARLKKEMPYALDGAAVAMAMGGAGLPGDKRFAISGNFATYQGHQAVAFTAQARVNDAAVLNASIGTGLKTGSVGGRVGVTFAW